jgi:antitoxin component YwqK of YwqJK toxin-antitoxin module
MKEIKKYHDKTTIISEHYYLDEQFRIQGEYKRWYKNGQLHLYCDCEDDLRNGEYKQWDQNGLLQHHSIWERGKLHGEYSEWDKNGKIIHDFFCNDKKITNKVLPYIDNPVIIKLKFGIKLLT